MWILRRHINFGAVTALFTLLASGIHAENLEKSKVPQRAVNLCEIDPEACDTVFLRAREFNFQAAPLCKLDPCACSKCDGLAWSGNTRFESVGDDGIALPANIEGLTKLNGTSVIVRSPAVAFDGLLGDRPVSMSAPAPSITFRLDRSGLIGQAKHDERSSLTCNVSRERPAEYWRELMVRQNETEQCSEAAELVLDQRSKLGMPQYLQVITGKRTRDQEKSAFKIFETYKNICLHPLADLKMTSSLNSLLGAQFVSNVKASVGELNRPGENVFCTASIARRSDGAAGLVTAAHCIGEVTRGAGDSRLQYAENYPEMTFTTFGGNQYAVQVDEDVIGYDYPDSQDAVFIPASGNRPLPAGFEIGKAPDLWEPLYIVGVNPFLGALSKATDPANNDLFAAASLSLEPGCRVYGISGRSLVHNCQTEKSMSGSPILVGDNGNARLVAVQSGETANPTIPECPAPTAAAANMGTLLNP